VIKHKYSKLLFSLTALTVLCFSRQAVYSEVVTRTYQVSASADDVYDYEPTGRVSVFTEHLMFGTDDPNRLPYLMNGMRFTNLDIPQGVIITNAFLKVLPYSPPFCIATVYAVIQAENTDNADGLGMRFLSELNTTTAAVNWDLVTPWQNLNTWYASPDIAPVIQEVIQRQGWSPGNSLVVLCSARMAGYGTLPRAFSSYDRGSSYAPKLEIYYETNSPVISGYVRTADGEGIENVLISANNGGSSYTTDNNGYYELVVPENWTGIVTPTKIYWSFIPGAIDYRNLTEDISNQNYIGNHMGIKVNAQGTGDFPTIQAAINAAQANEEVVLMPGTFQGPGNRDLDFKGKQITVRSSEPDNWIVVTSTIIDCQGSQTDPHRGFRFDSGESNNSILTGITIINGFPPEEFFNYQDYRFVGGAVYCRNGSPTISSCIIRDNMADDEGGGICCRGTNPRITNCRIYGNKAHYGAGIYIKDGSPIIENCDISSNGEFGFIDSPYGLDWPIGGGIYSLNGSPSILNSSISFNKATHGGGLCLVDSTPLITGCIIQYNECDLLGYQRTTPMGGGIVISGGDNTLDKNVIFKNSAVGQGGGISISSGGTTNINNCAVTGNYSYNYGSPEGYGGGIMCIWGESSLNIKNSAIYSNYSNAYGGGVFIDGNKTVNIDNSIVWGNAAPMGGELAIMKTWSLSGPSTLTVSNSNLRSSAGGIYIESGEDHILNLQGNNIDANPMLTPDSHLKSGSPCLDSSNCGLTIDFDGETRPVDIPGVGGESPEENIFDMGIDELADSDDDGLPDWWENIYFGSPVAAYPDADDDGDGLTNLQEYEMYGSNPIAQPYYVSETGDNSNSGLSLASAKRTIQAAIDVAGDGGTILVDCGDYSMYSLYFQYKALIIKSLFGPECTTIHGHNDRITLNELGVNATLEGILFDKCDINNWNYSALDYCRVIFKNCVLKGNSSTGKGGKLQCRYVNLSCDQMSLQPEPDPSGQISAGFIHYSNVYLQDHLTLEKGMLELRTSLFDGPGVIALNSNSMFNISGGQDDGPSVIRTDIIGPGDIEIDMGQQLIVAGDAIVDLQRQPGDTCVDSEGGKIIVNGELVVTDQATIRNSTVCVNQAKFEGNNIIQNNDIRLIEASTNYGGQFYVQDSAAIIDNYIISEGDRYLDLDPDPDNRNTQIHNNIIEVIIKSGAPIEQGTLLELRARDYDCGSPNNPFCESGAFQVPASSPGFTVDPSENWVLEKLVIEENAKLNLTNRQGFEFQDPGITTPETVYVKELVLYPNSVLNTALQTLYYQSLVDENGVELTRDPHDPSAPLANGSRIVDIPLLGFSLGVIAMEDDTEFDVRIQKRLTDPADFDPVHPYEPLPEGSITREDGLVPGFPGVGVMDMQTMDASSIAAKGSFARAGNEQITVFFEYKFLENPNTELVVYLSNTPEVGQNNFEVARVRPPNSDRAGSFASDEFAIFCGTFSSSGFNFTRGVYVELELCGANSRCWVKNWDPQVICTFICADFTGDNAVAESDYLTLIAESGQPVPDGKGCLDLVGDGFVNLNDILAWDLAFYGLNACGPGSTSAMMSPSEQMVMSTVQLTQGSEIAAPLLITGKPNGDGFQEDFLYTAETNGTCLDPPTSPTCPSPEYCGRANGRLVKDSTGRLYQIQGVYGLVRRDTGMAVIEPKENLPFNGSTVQVGIISGSGLALTDAVFNPDDPNIIYVVPVLVTSPGSECPYKAAAKLVLHNDPDPNYSIAMIYGKDPSTDPDVTVTSYGCDDIIMEPDFQQIHEIEIDVFGNLFVTSSQALNDNDWMLIYHEATGNASELRVLLTDVLEGLTALFVSSSDDRLYLASSVNSLHDAKTRVFRFNIQYSGNSVVGITFDDFIDINNPTAGDMGYGYLTVITSITENPVDRSLYVTGYTAPKYSDNDTFNNLDPIFTTPTLAVIPHNSSGTITATEISGFDLALPLSVIWTGTTGEADWCYGADLNFSGEVDFIDFSMFAVYWLDSNCVPPDWCGGADLNPDLGDRDQVDIVDLGILTAYWLETDCSDQGN